jgi:hypothetical protein
MWHGIPGALALILGVFQFSTRLRQRFSEAASDPGTGVRRHHSKYQPHHMLKLN